MMKSLAVLVLKILPKAEQLMWGCSKPVPLSLLRSRLLPKEVSKRLKVHNDPRNNNRAKHNRC